VWKVRVKLLVSDLSGDKLPENIGPKIVVVSALLSLVNERTDSLTLCVAGYLRHSDNFDFVADPELSLSHVQEFITTSP
jgi:hypothetical protein